MTHRLKNWAALGLLLLASPTLAKDRERVAAEFIHDQVWITPCIDGRTLKFFSDSGGGWNAINEAVVARLHFEVSTAITREDGAVKLTSFPKTNCGWKVPSPPPDFMQGRLMLGNDRKLDGRDGFLGGRWFAGGIWEFDYPHQRLYRLDAFDSSKEAAHRAELHFQTDQSGKRTTHFPRITIHVDDEALEVLLDTGATAKLTDTSAPVFGLPAGSNIGTSFIEHAVFERWRQRHPEWRVIETADDKGSGGLRRMIEVAEVTVANQRIGPVWFAEQPAGSFQRYMAQWMDQPIWGALGGSGLRYLRVVIDYPGSAAHFYAKR